MISIDGKMDENVTPQILVVKLGGVPILRLQKMEILGPTDPFCQHLSTFRERTPPPLL